MRVFEAKTGSRFPPGEIAKLAGSALKLQKGPPAKKMAELSWAQTLQYGRISEGPLFLTLRAMGEARAIFGASKTQHKIKNPLLAPPTPLGTFTIVKILKTPACERAAH